MGGIEEEIDLGHTTLKFFNGIQYIIRKSGTFTGDMAREITLKRKEVLNSIPSPTLVLTNKNFIDESAKKYVQSDEFKKDHCASSVAIVSNNRAKIMILRVITSYMKISCPIKFFTKQEDGEEWLKQFISK